MEEKNLIIFNDGELEIGVKIDKINDTVWLSQKDMSNLFGCSTDNISLHLKISLNVENFAKKTVIENSSVTASDGKKYNVRIYNLDAIISIGYRVNSVKGVKFRQWATKIIKEYTLKGFVYNKQ